MKTVTPVYPQKSIDAKRTGIAVAEVCVAPNSRVANAVKIIAAPDEAIGKSLQQAISQWTFGPLWRREDPSRFLSYQSNVTYYFVEQSGRWVVLSPTDSFYVGPLFALKQQKPYSVRSTN